jgi:hypothetical protein
MCKLVPVSPPGETRPKSGLGGGQSLSFQPAGVRGARQGCQVEIKRIGVTSQVCRRRVWMRGSSEAGPRTSGPSALRGKTRAP